MRLYGTLHPTERASMPPDTCVTLAPAANTGAAADWPAGANMVTLSGLTTAGAQLNFYVNMHSTNAAYPGAGTTSATASSAGSTGISIPIQGVRTMQIPGDSTGFSVITPTSGLVHAEVWKR